MVKPHQLEPRGVWFLASCGVLLGTMGMFFPRFLPEISKALHFSLAYGEKIHVAENKLSQNMRRWTWRCHCFIYWVNAKIRFYWKILLFSFSGSKADDNLLKYLAIIASVREKKLSDENKALGWFRFWWLCFERTVQCWSAHVKSWSGKHQILFNGRICIFCGFIFAAQVISLLSLFP